MAKGLTSIEDLLEKQPDEGATPEDKAARSKQAKAISQFEEKMHDVRLKELEEETQKRAAELGVPYVDLKGFPIAPEAIKIIPEDKARAFNVVCFLYTGPQIRLASTNPENPDVKNLLHELTQEYGAKGAVYQISEESLSVALETYAKLPKVKEIVKGVKVSEEELARFQEQLKTYKDIQPVLDDASVSDMITIVMAAGLQFDTSDIHIEAEEEQIAVRFRIDGVLQDVGSIDADMWKKIIARIKLISGLKINITDRPQDGRFTIFLKEGDTDVRVSTIPTNWGESVVMRLLKPSAISVTFEQLGFRPLAEEKLLKEVQKPHGMIITTGPTGSGKTTTLYAILRKRNTPGVKIITLEDPIEYKLEGINQSQIDHDKGYTFAGGLRSILRQDPDVVMVGEIRDLETAEVAINAALTGHLLISTLHTNDAAGAIPRYIAMGVKPFLLAPALNAILGQRLARRIHEDCKEEYTPEPDKLEFLKNALAEIPEASGETVKPESEWVFERGKGCAACNDTGYKGRVGIYEILVMTEEIRGSMSEKISEYEVRKLAKEQGMVTMQQDGALKVLDRITTIDEVLRVAGGAE